MKYHNAKVRAGDEVFDSRYEYNRWCELRLLERAGQITDLKRQVKFELIPKQEGEWPVYYVADFVYSRGGQKVVEDAKGFKTPDYIIKRKLMLYVHQIRVNEV